jgi:hypothetical protein
MSEKDSFGRFARAGTCWDGDFPKRWDELSQYAGGVPGPDRFAP